MATQASLFLRLQTLPIVLGRKLVTRRAVKRFHPADVCARLGVTSDTVLSRWLDRVQRRQMTGQAF